MKQNVIVGREKEQLALQRCMESDRSELVVVYGRRRVGKTFLIDQYFKGNFDFTFVGGHNLTQRIQLRLFSKALKSRMGVKRLSPLKDWFDAFDALEAYLESLPHNRKKVVFIDEMPWIDSLKSSFVQAFENFWNGWAARRNDIVFIVTGSATSWMIDKLVENQGGLHARITCHLYLRPFTLNETEQYVRSRMCEWDRFQIAQCYMCFGGVPFYLSLLDFRQSLAQNIDSLCFTKGGALHREFDELFNALFIHADQYVQVVKVLSEHRYGMTKKEISEATKIGGGKLSKIITNLERCDFVVKFRYYGKKRQDSIYRLTDFFTLFYFKYIEPNISSFDENWWSHHLSSPSVVAWQGFSFELLCLMHLPQIRKTLGISGVVTDVSAWFCKGDSETGKRGGQIDLIIERADRIIHLCEMKFSQAPFKITSDYEMRLRERMGLFQYHTKTTKSLVNTFITTFGVSNGKHLSIVHSEVILDNLFQA